MFCLSFRSVIIHPRKVPIKPNTRRNVPGSRLFREISGHARAEIKIVGFLGAIQSGSPPGAFGPNHLDSLPERPNK